MKAWPICGAGGIAARCGSKGKLNTYQRGHEPACPMRGPRCRGVIRMRGARACHPCSRMKAEPAPTVYLDGRGFDEPRPLLAFEQAWAVWLQAIGAAKDRYAGPAAAKARQGRLRILVVPDLHAPFHDPAAVAAMLEREKD